MQLDFSDYKVEVFEGINDEPVPPTANKAGNGSHLIKKLNDFVDETQASLNYLSYNGGYYFKIVEQDYVCNVYDYILLKPTQDNTFTITLPPPTTSIGDWIVLCSFTTNNTITINLSGAFRFNGVPEPQVIFKGARQPVSLIWTGNDSLGWMTTSGIGFNVVDTRME